MAVRVEEGWRKALADQWEAPYFGELARFVHDEYRNGTVYPPASQVFAAFDACPFEDVRVVHHLEA